MTKAVARFALGLSFVLLGGCGGIVVLNLPEKTALENQVIGTYEYLRSEDRVFLSEPGIGVRTTPPDVSAPIIPSGDQSLARKNVVTAVLHQEFQRLDIARFKKQGWIGEKSTGYLDLFRERIPEEYLERLEKLVSDENTDRRTIIDGVIALNPKLSEKSRTDIEAVFAKLYRESSRSGDWVQTAGGKWEQVP